MNDKPKLSRKDFMTATVVGIGGLLSALIGVPSIIFLTEPALKKSQAGGWMRIGSASKVAPGVPTLFSLVVERQTGWITDQEEVMAYLYTEDGRSFIAMSNICTHLACRVRWLEDRQEFLSPCHNGRYDKFGTVLGGPPPRPLDRYEVKVENDDIFIKVG